MNILLLDPNYESKFPPLGLMKMAYYHKEYRGDFVWLAKGNAPQEVSETVRHKLEQSKYYAAWYNIGDFVSMANDVMQNQKWDRVYVTTLFTYEWNKTIAAIEYAKTLVDNISQVYVGGILTTLMPNELEAATGIKPMTGLLTDSSVLGFEDNVNIDLLTPDYSILDLLEYYYPESEHYLVRATRGCGMKCSFCAVQTLEPDCIDYLPLKDLVREIDEKYGARRNLLLMDNNILKSAHYFQIMRDIEELGYGRGAVKTNPKTGKQIQVFVDFNQGLDMNFITEPKMAAMARLAVRPVRIAFDHISDRERYIKAMELADQYNVGRLSNYMLYSTTEFKGKGKAKAADTPKDLYDRLALNVALQEQFNVRRRREGISQVVIFSFPMKFIPLGNRDRAFVGTNWNPKMIRTFQRMTNHTGGAIHSTRKGFEQVFGKTYDEFHALLQAPALYLEKRIKHSNKTWRNLWSEWQDLYQSLAEQERSSFEELIACNEFTAETYMTVESPTLRKLYAHYLHGTKFLEFVEAVATKNLELYYELQDYIACECPEILFINMELLHGLKGAGRYHYDLITLLFTDMRLAA